MRIYLDSCALNRLFDLRSHPRVRLEAEAVEHFFCLLEEGQIFWVASDVVEDEILSNPQESVKASVVALMALCDWKIPLNDSILQRGEMLEQLGYGAFDALHLACAESGNADLLLTTDDRFLRKTQRGLGNPLVRTANPVDWRQEIGR